MEDDNALDIIKWMFKETTTVDLSGPLKMEQNGKSIEWEAKLRGNILALKPTNGAVEPILIVCEKLQVKKCVDIPRSFCLKYGINEIVLSVPSEEDVDQWMLKLATSSHLHVQAELDQTIDKYYSRVNASTTLPDASKVSSIEGNSHYFLTAPYKKDHSFSVYQSVSVPSRKIVCTEVMFESKLSLVIPLDMVKLFIKWTSEMRDDLLGNLWTVKNSVIVEALHNAVRHCNSNIEIYTQAAEFLESYVGPSFRSSTEKFRMAFSAVPTNLHIQYFQINGAPTSYFLTSGATAAVPLRFTNGGLHRIRNKFAEGLEPSGLDHTNEIRYYSRRCTLLSAKRQIGELTRRIDLEWHLGAFGLVDKVGVQIFSEMKQLHETVCDLINSFPNISNLVDSLCEGGYAQLTKSGVPDILSNQLDSLDAMMISLNSKMAVIDKIDDNSKGREAFQESAKLSLNSTLDVLLQLVESLLLAQLLSLVVTFRKSADCQTFFHIQLRNDLLLSQSVTLVATALLANLENADAGSSTFHWPPLVNSFSFLSCYGDERGMMEDLFDVWNSFPTIVQFRFIPISSSVSQTCIPQIDGHRSDLKVSIPVKSCLLEKLPMNIVAGGWFRVRTAFWNIGINHEATLAASIGDISLEENINRTALAKTQAYVSALGENLSKNDIIQELLIDLEKVTNSHVKKNTAIYPRVMALNSVLGASSILSCKSGKDRTSMAVTLEQGRLLKENCSISQQQTTEIIDCLRRDGVRRENCRKNVGKAIYSFSPFQMHFLPKEFRPPNGTYAQKMAS